MTVRQVLADTRGRELIEELEWGCSDQELVQDWKDELKKDFNFTYQD